MPVERTGGGANRALLSDEQLASLSPAQRRELIQRLVRYGVSAPSLPRGRRRRRLLMVAAVGSAVLVPWIGCAGRDAAAPLRRRHWTLAWVGFDLALLAGLVATGWMTWHARPALVFPALVTATLLVCDAWFDTTTAGRADVRVSVVSAVALELPLAVLLLAAVWTVLRNVTVSVAPSRVARDPRPEPPSSRP